MQYIRLLFLLLIVFTLIPKTYAQESDSSEPSANRDALFDSVEVCYKQNGFAYKFNQGIYSIDCTSHTGLLTFDINGSRGLDPQAVDQNAKDKQLQIIETDSQNLEVNPYNFFSFFSNTVEKEFLAQRDFMSQEVVLPEWMSVIQPDLAGSHKISLSGWVDLLQENSSIVNFSGSID